MEHVWQKIDDLRLSYPILGESSTPIDVFSFFELDLRLDAIPFDDLDRKYRAEAAITADFKGLYIDAEQYNLLENAPAWKLNRLRFTIAHELGHYFLHQDLPQAEDFKSVENFARWTANYKGRKYTVEQEANEFAGRLLVPLIRIQEMYDTFAERARELVANFERNEQLRIQFAEQIAPKFGVNTQVITTRLDRDGIWPSA